MQERSWVAQAVALLTTGAAAEVDTPLIDFPLPSGVRLMLKDESAHPTGSLKHRLARSLMLYGLCNGWITEGTTLVEASSGSTAVSLAYFAELLGLRFIAVLPRSTSQEKVDLITASGGTCHFVDRASEVIGEAERLTAEVGGHYLNQFAHAERATDWRGNNNIAESIFDQVGEPPTWIVVGAGTGGTSATLGRYIRYRGFPTNVMVVDPEGSAFFDAWHGSPAVPQPGSAIEGIGRPTREPSFLPHVIDRIMRVPDPCSVATMRMLHTRLGLRTGPSTGTALYGALTLVQELVAAGEPGSVVSLICDRGDRYAHTYYDDAWVAAQGWDLVAAEAALQTLLAR